jgi:pilus assembly protein CpaF
MRRLPDDSRKVVEVVEVGIDKEGLPHTQLLFEFQQTGAEGGKIVGRIEATGKIPVWVSKIEEAGIELPENTFIPVLY